MNLAATRTEISPLPPGDPGVALTIRRMRKLIDQGKSSTPVRALALSILNDRRVPAFAWEQQARAIYDWVLRNITFTPDPVGKEGLQTAEWTLAYRRGDCDDFTTLLSSLLGTIGMDTRIVTIAGDPRDPSQFSHVYPEVKVDGRWIPVDAARRRPQFALPPAHYSRKRVWSVTTEGWTDMGRSHLGADASTPPWARRGAFRAHKSAVWARGNPLLGRLRGIPRQMIQRGRRNYRTLGDDDSGFDWSSLPGVITAATTGTANIITAERASPYNLFPTTATSAALARGVPAGYSSAPQTPVVAAPFFGGMSNGTLLAIGAGLFGLALLARR